MLAATFIMNRVHPGSTRIGRRRKKEKNDDELFSLLTKKIMMSCFHCRPLFASAAEWLAPMTQGDFVVVGAA